GLRCESRVADAGLSARDREGGDRLLVRLEAERAVGRAYVLDSGLGQADHPRACGLGRTQPPSGRRGGEQVAKRALVDDPAFSDDRDAVAEVLYFVQEMAREQHGQ